MSPLSFETTPDSERQVREIDAFLAAISLEARDRFVASFAETVERLCEELPERIERRVPLIVDEAASLHFSRPVYRERFETTAQRSRRSASGVWFLYYLLIDGDGDGQPETLRVVAVRHAAARPFSVEDDAE